MNLIYTSHGKFYLQKKRLNLVLKFPFELKTLGTKDKTLFYLRSCFIDFSLSFCRDKIIKDLQDNIRIEQQYEKERKEFEAEEAKNRQKQLEQTHTILSRHWRAYMKNMIKLEEEENVSIYNLIGKFCYLIEELDNYIKRELPIDFEIL